MKRMPSHQKAAILWRAAELLERRSERFVECLALEAGKPVKDGAAEVQRGVQLLKFAAEVSKTRTGELVNMDAAVGGENRIGFVQYVPLGVVAAIAPFNFPLNLVLHKLAPAFAAGNTVVLKPAEKTPLTSLMLAEIFEQAGLPEGALNVVLGKGSEIGDALITDERIEKITFTGSVPVGLNIQRKAGLKKLTLELGSNSPNLIFGDADLYAAAQALIRGAFAYSGQVCISAQRIYVHEDVYQPFLDIFLPLVNRLKVGDPMDPATDIGPMISEADAERTEAKVKEAVAQGARLLTGGVRRGAVFHPTVLTSVERNMAVVCEELFAPVVSVIPFRTEEEAISMANDSEFGLQAGLFTADINRAFRVADALETGGVWINDISTYRQDNYPYGGVKMSGIGKEGVKYAVEEMSAKKFIGLKLY
jgi:acyl-CoA reductase-like NAD-dependent aldehyde dehydrogenase